MSIITDKEIAAIANTHGFGVERAGSKYGVMWFGASPVAFGQAVAAVATLDAQREIAVLRRRLETIERAAP